MKRKNKEERKRRQYIKNEQRQMKRKEDKKIHTHERNQRENRFF